MILAKFSPRTNSQYYSYLAFHLIILFCYFYYYIFSQYYWPTYCIHFWIPPDFLQYLVFIFLFLSYCNSFNTFYNIYFNFTFPENYLPLHSALVKLIRAKLFNYMKVFLFYILFVYVINSFIFQLINTSEKVFVDTCLATITR